MAAVKTSCSMLKVSTLSDSIANFIVAMLASVSSGSKLGWKQVLFFLTMEKARSSTALEWGIVKISLTPFQARGKRRAFWVFPMKFQSEFKFKSPRSVLHDSITWSGTSLSRGNWYSLNSSVKESNSDGSLKDRRIGCLWKQCRYTLTYLIETLKRTPINKMVRIVKCSIME